MLAGDRGYCGQWNTKIQMPERLKRMTHCTRRKKHANFRMRAGIEPVTGHYKSYGKELLQESFRGLHKRYARGCRIQLQKSHEFSLVRYRNGLGFVRREH